MKGTRALSFLLALALLASLVIPGSFVLPAKADTDNGMRISKTATKNTDGTYTITLEAYATGSKVISEVTEDVPADIVLVLDQSGSMEQSMNTYSFQPYENRTNSQYYNLRHNGGNNPNLYYQMKDGGYAAVSVQRTQALSYDPIENQNNLYYYSNQNNLYVIYEGEYHRVTVDRSGGVGNGRYTYTFTPNGGREITILSDDTWNNIPDFGTYGPLYLASDSGYSYTYTYTDENGVTQTIGTSEGASTYPKEYTFYERYVSSTTQRLAALKSAVTGFADSVAKKAMGADGVLGTGDDVDHRIAVVGFACSNTGNNDNYNNYQNTELFIGSTQYKYGTAAQGQYSNAFQNMKTTTGQSNVTASINALQADGATYVNHGLEIANGILNANPVPEGQERSRIVIVFTDGVPGYSGYESDVANSAITQANTSRSNGANVYAVGIFEGADATSAGNSNGSDTQKANWFMQNLSDNKGTPQSPSYYLSASDSGTLSTIFQQIANNIETGGSSTTLDGNTVIKDLVSDYFQLPAGTTSNKITVETVPCTSITNDVPAWGDPVTFEGATVEVDPVTGDVSVTGFDFAANYVGMDSINGEEQLHNPAKMLRISFDVVPKDGFLGGNNVPTNTSAGVYKDSSSTTPAFTFEQPEVNVLIDTVTVTAGEKNVYLLDGLTGTQLKEGATVKVGNVELYLNRPNYGLESWQTDYVDITVEVKDKNGTIITDLAALENLTDDQNYTISVTVKPKYDGNGADGTANPMNVDPVTGTGKINVFKPVLTYKDSEVYYGDSVPTDFSGNLYPTEWKHVGTLDTAVTMIGTKPVLTTTNTPDISKIADGKINTKQDIPVDVTVSIDGTPVTSHTTFAHEDCASDAGCRWTTPNPNNGSPAFLLHVKTCQLTITKNGGDSTEPYVFNVLKDGTKYSEVTIVGNNSATIYELPVGTYTIQEDTGWSWRYPNPSYTGNDVTLSAANPNGTITCTNSISKQYWLNGFSSVVKNIFNKAG